VAVCANLDIKQDHNNTSTNNSNTRIPMKYSIVKAAVAATVGIMISGSLQAGNIPNSARTLTGGIGSGTTHGRIPSSHPGTRSRAPSYRNSRGADYTGHYRSGLSHRPSSSTLSTSSSGNRPGSVPGASRWNSHAQDNAGGRIPSSLPPAGGSGSRPDSVPGTSHWNSHAQDNAGSRIPSSLPPGGGSTIGSTSTGIPASVGTVGAPASLPPSLPDAASAGRVPTSIPPVASGGDGMPPSMPDVTAGHLPAAAAGGLDRRGGGRP
jgi:hypothetical protein